jgi:DNA-binding NtrC family response regulator
MSTVGTKEPRGGNDVFRSLKIVNKDVISILYLAYNHRNFAVINEPQQNSAARFFQKPFSSQDIGIAIKNALAQYAPLSTLRTALIAQLAGLHSSIRMFSRPTALARCTVRPGDLEAQFVAASVVP